MLRTLILLAVGAGANALASLSAIAETPPEVTLTLPEGGTPQAPIDVNAASPIRIPMPDSSCSSCTAATSSSTATIT